MDQALLAVGLGELDERVYEALLARHSASLAELCRASGLRQRDVRAALSTLERAGLVSRLPSQPPRFIPSPPDAAIEVLVLQRLEALERARLAARGMQERYQTALRKDIRREVVEIVTGRDAIVRRWHQLQRSAKESVRGFDRPPYMEGATLNTTELELLRRGIGYRFIYDREAVEIEGRVESIKTLVAAGEEARLLVGVPMKLFIADRKHALIVLTQFVPGDEQALVVHSSRLLDALMILFETMWERALPLQFGERDQSPTPDELAAIDRDLLVLLSAGLKDEAIARQLGIGVRTVERRIKSIMQTLGAETRFQAGMRAAERGWVGASGHAQGPARKPAQDRGSLKPLRPGTGYRRGSG